MRINKSNRIISNNRYYNRAIETANHIYFVCFDTSVLREKVKMYDRKMRLVSENIESYNSLSEVLEKNDYGWVSKKMKENLFIS
jgi:hypothetical protein